MDKTRLKAQRERPIRSAFDATEGTGRQYAQEMYGGLRIRQGDLFVETSRTVAVTLHQFGRSALQYAMLKFATTGGATQPGGGIGGAPSINIKDGLNGIGGPKRSIAIGGLGADVEGPGLASLVVGFPDASNGLDHTGNHLARFRDDVIAFRRAVLLDDFLRLAVFTVSTAPDAAEAGTGAIIHVTNGAAGAAVLAFSNGTNWLRCDTRATISSS